jgi:adenosylcobinamide-phosphate synthase
MLLLAITPDAPPYNPLIILAAALVVEAVVGNPRLPDGGVPHPIRLLGRLIDWLDRKLNRPCRPAYDLRIRGACVVLLVCGLTAGFGLLVARFSASHPIGALVELVLVVVLLAQRSLFDHVRAVAIALQRSGLSAGRSAVAHIVGRDVETLDQHGVARAAIESCAENFADAVVAPTLWYVLLGFPGLLVFKAVNTMDSMLGHDNARHRAFGMAAAHLDDVANWIPARIAGIYLVAAALLVPTARAGRAARTMMRDSRNHRSPNSGWPESAAAGALGLALAGPRRYGEVVVDGPWIGSGRAGATAGDIERALWLYAAGCGVNGLIVVILIVVGGVWLEP